MTRLYPRTAHRTARPGPAAKKLLVSLAIFLAVLACKYLYPQGMASVQDLLLGQEGGRVQRGISAMTEALDQHQGLSEAVEAFWEGLHSLEAG